MIEGFARRAAASRGTMTWQEVLSKAKMLTDRDFGENLIGHAWFCQIMLVAICTAWFHYVVDPQMRRIFGKTMTPVLFLGVLCSPKDSLEVTVGLMAFALFNGKLVEAPLRELERKTTLHALAQTNPVMRLWQKITLKMSYCVVSSVDFNWSIGVDRAECGVDPDDISDFEEEELRASGAAVVWMGIVMMAVIAVVVRSPTAVITAALIYVFAVVITDGAPTESFETIPSEGCRRPLPTGIYRITRFRLCMGPVYGVGVTHGGTFHTRWHVTEGAPLVIQGETFHPTYTSKDRDICCYFGAPKFNKTEENDEYYAVVVDIMDGTRVVRTEPRVTPGGRVYFKLPKTTPGTSGSPVYIIRHDPDVLRDADATEYVPSVEDIGGRFPAHLAGLTGMFINKSVTPEYRGLRETQTEVFHPPSTLSSDFEFGMYETGHRQYFAHPGKGKTRTVVPEIVRKGKAAERLVVVMAPTRMICKDIVRLLENDESLRVYDGSAGGLRTGDPDVIVIPHAVAATWLVTKHRPFTKNAIFIMDESHMCDTSTILVKKYLTRTLGRDQMFLEMTATGMKTSGEVVIESGSNFPIVDNYIREEEALSLIIDLANKKGTGKIVVFCPVVVRGEYSVNELATEIERRTAAPVVKFSRATYEENYKRATSREEGNMVVLTTNMSEIGANLWADVVVDYDQAMTFRYDPDSAIVERYTTMASEAQHVQRRGRIGRQKKGTYYCVKRLGRREPMYPEDCAENIDSEIILTALGCGKRHHLPTVLTYEQVQKWFSSPNDISGATTVRRAWTGTGTKVPEHDIIYELEREVRNAPRNESNQIDINKSIEYLRQYDARDRRWYEIMLAKMRRFKSRAGEDVPALEAGDAPEILEVCMHGPTEENELDLEHVGLKAARKHYHRCGKKKLFGNCDHTWFHVHSEEEVFKLHRNGLICPCCRD